MNFLIISRWQKMVRRISSSKVKRLSSRTGGKENGPNSREASGASRGDSMPEGEGKCLLDCAVEVMTELSKEFEGSSNPPMKTVSKKNSHASRTFSKVQILENETLPLATITEKLGAAANNMKIQGDFPAPSSNRSAAFQEISGFLKDFSNLQWVGTLVLVLHVIIERISTVKKNRSNLRKAVEKLLWLGRHVVKESGRAAAGQDQDHEYNETLRKALELVWKHGAACIRATKISKFQRYVLANSYKDSLASLEKEITDLYPWIFMGRIENLERNIEQCLHLHIPRMFRKLLNNETKLVGSNKRKNEALEMMNLKECGSSTAKAVRVKTFVVFGMKGVGTSTFCISLARDLTTSNLTVANYCWIDMTDANILQKQQELCSCLSSSRQKPDISDPEHGRQVVKRHCEELKKPVLFLIDNIHDREQLKQLLPERFDRTLPHGSIVLVATSDRILSNTMMDMEIPCRSYELEKLGQREASILLGGRIFKSTVEHPDLKKWMQGEELKELLQVCGGLPKVLDEIGRYIFSCGFDTLAKYLEESGECNLESAYINLSSDESRSVLLSELTTAVNHARISLLNGDPLRRQSETLHCWLNFCITRLPEGIQTTFLDICLLHEQKPWERMQYLLDQNHLQTLNQLSMVKRMVTSYGNESMTVSVPSVLKGLCRRMSYHPVNSYQGCTRKILEDENGLSSYGDIDQTDSKLSPRVIKLKYKADLQAQLLDRSKNKLEYLELEDTTVIGVCKEFFLKLTYLECKRSGIPFQHLGQIPAVKFLRLTRDPNSTLPHMPLQIVQSLRQLKQLIIENHLELERLGSGLDSLEAVKIKKCPNFRQLGPLSSNLRRLRIEECPQFHEIRALNYPNLEELGVVDCDLQEIPEGLGENLPDGLRILDFSGNSSLKKIPKWSLNNRVSKLSLKNCSSLSELPDDILAWSQLEVLQLKGCKSLVSIAIPSKLSTTAHRYKIVDVPGCDLLTQENLSKLKHFFSCDQAKCIYSRGLAFLAISGRLQGASTKTAETPGEKMQPTLSMQTPEVTKARRKRAALDCFKGGQVFEKVPSQNTTETRSTAENWGADRQGVKGGGQVFERVSSKKDTTGRLTKRKDWSKWRPLSFPPFSKDRLRHCCISRSCTTDCRED